MDNIFGVGLPELIVIMIIAGMVLGPERIVRASRTLGVLTGRLQKISRGFVRQLQSEVSNIDEDGQLQSTVDELNQLRRQFDELKREVIGLTSAPIVETRETFREIKREAENSIMPPGLAPQASVPSGSDNAIHRPPSLVPPVPPTNGGQVSSEKAAAAPVSLPQRLEIAEDPD